MKLLFTILTLLMSLLGYGQITSRNANEVIPRSIRSLGDRIPQVDVLPSVPNLLQYTGDAASGAFVYCRCTADTSKRGVYYWEVNQWVRLTSGDVSFLITDFDSTGQLRGRLLFSGRNYKVVSSPRLLVDSINSKVVINNSNVSVGGPQTKLFVGGNVVSTDTVKGYALQVNGITELEDTTTSKPMIIDEDGNTFRLKYWSMVGIGGGGLTYPNTANKYLNGYGNFVTLNSDSLTEGSTNQFFTNARARAAISLTTTGTSGAATYNSSTGVLNIPNYAGGGGGGGTPAGSNGQVQFNNSGAFGASSNFNWDAANNRLGILTASPQRPLHIAGTSQGVLLPRLTTAQKNAIASPQDGELVYDTDQRNLATYSGATATWIAARSLLGYNPSTTSLFVTDGTGIVTGANANNTILQQRSSDFPGTGHVIIGKAAAASASGSPIGITAIGNEAGFYNSSSYSTLVGQLAGAYTTNGTGTTIVGAYAYAQGSFITGAGNSIFGAFNHRYGVAGAYNSAFGYQTNWFGGGNYNITLGAFVDQQSTTATGYLNIGNVIYGLGLHQSASNSSTPTTAGQIGIGVAQSGISASAKLQVDATDKGFLPPRMTTTQMNAISSPAAGLMIYNTTENATMTFDGTRWVGFRYNGTNYQGYNSTDNTWTNLN